jgi:hypothetical protein
MSDTKTARTYNQTHVPRKYTPGQRRVSMYIAWSYPAEAGRNPSELDNRFSTMTEVRRVAWPAYEAPQWSDSLQFQQGIAGALELFFWAWAPFQQFVGETTGHVLPVFQRIDQAGFKLPLDERVLADADTLLVFGLDHVVTGQEPPAAYPWAPPCLAGCSSAHSSGCLWCRRYMSSSNGSRSGGNPSPLWGERVSRRSCTRRTVPPCQRRCRPETALLRQSRSTPRHPQESDDDEVDGFGRGGGNPTGRVHAGARLSATDASPAGTAS